MSFVFMLILAFSCVSIALAGPLPSAALQGPSCPAVTVTTILTTTIVNSAAVPSSVGLASDIHPNVILSSADQQTSEQRITSSGLRSTTSQIGTAMTPTATPLVPVRSPESVPISSLTTVLPPIPNVTTVPQGCNMCPESNINLLDGRLASFTPDPLCSAKPTEILSSILQATVAADSPLAQASAALGILRREVDQAECLNALCVTFDAGSCSEVILELGPALETTVEAVRGLPLRIDLDGRIVLQDSGLPSANLRLTLTPNIRSHQICLRTNTTVITDFPYRFISAHASAPS